MLTLIVDFFWSCFWVIAVPRRGTACALDGGCVRVWEWTRGDGFPWAL